MMKFKHHTYYLKRAYSIVTKALWFPPLVVFIAILLITVWPLQNARQNVVNDRDRAVDERVKVVEVNLKNKFAAYNGVLQSASGLVQANPSLSKQQWDTFFNVTKASTDVSDVQGIAYVKVFSETELPSVNEFMNAQGFSDFSVYPLEPTRPRYSSILYIYPDTDASKPIVGLDMLTVPARKQTMDAAANSAQPTISHKVKLLQKVSSDDQYGFIMFVPIYQTQTPPKNSIERQQQLSGYISGGFRSKRLFSPIVDSLSKTQHFSLKIYDTSTNSEDLLYQTANTREISRRDHTRTVHRTMNLYGVRWQFVYTFDNSKLISRSEQNAPAYTFVVGFITALLVFLVLLSIFKSRARELQQQKDHEVNLAKDELLSLASHQMRTPATGVKQYLGMVLQGFVGELLSDQKDLLQKAYTSNERQLHVINQILQLAKLESGRVVLAKHETNLNELLKDIVDEQRDEVKAHGHVLKEQIAKRPAIIMADSHMLRMAIENLLSNAIKYTTESGTITVKLSQDKHKVLVSIKDSGIGIDTKQFPFIFKQFTRLYDEKAEQVSGTGVGLYLADQLIRRHKGTLSVDSIKGKGSTFTICLQKNRNKKQ